MIITFKGIDLSGWMFTDTNRFCICPRCGAQPPDVCRSPKGRVNGTPHGERFQEFQKLKIPGEVYEGRIQYNGIASYCATLGDDWSVREDILTKTQN